MRWCRRCEQRPAKSPFAWYCYGCNPGPSGPPPCRACGSTRDYYTSGLCARCHRNSPHRIDSCLDCLAWGALRLNKWLCAGCRGARRKGDQAGVCAHCRRQVVVNGDEVCRLCRRHILTLAPEDRPAPGTFIGAHQLFLADMFRTHGRSRPEPAIPRRRGAVPALLPGGRPRSGQLALFTVVAPPRPDWQPRRCLRCGHRPVRDAHARHCLGCAPGGPLTPPPCRRCGTTEDYYTSGLCIRCHRRSPARLDSCRDCFAWPARRGNGWLCEGCRGWRRNHAVGGCTSCARRVALDDGGVCRLCRKQVSMLPGKETGELAELTRHGHQLFLADMFVGLGATKTEDRERRRRLRARRAAPAAMPRTPARHVQTVAFDARRDFRHASRNSFGEPRDPVAAAYLDACVVDHGRRHGWGLSLTRRARAGVRLLLAFQDTPGAAIKASDAVPLRALGIVVRPLLDVLSDIGWLDDDRVPSIELWFRRHTAALPAPMAGELRTWFDVTLHGSRRPPRSHPRQPQTAYFKLRHALPALAAWVAAGHDSLRSVTRADVLAVLPPGGLDRTNAVYGLRSIFRVLRAHGRVFTNPASRIRVDEPPERIPLPLPASVIRDALNSDDPLRAAVAALLAFHGLQRSQLAGLKLTDVRHGRLHLDGRVIPLAEPVRQRVRAYLDYRTARWPNTINPHLFVHGRTATRTCRVQPIWLTHKLGISAQALREDRILDEARASGGDIRRLCDLFGLSVSGAERYVRTHDNSPLASYPPPLHGSLPP